MIEARELFLALVGAGIVLGALRFAINYTAQRVIRARMEAEYENAKAGVPYRNDGMEFEDLINEHDRRLHSLERRQATPLKWDDQKQMHVEACDADRCDV